MRSDRTELTCGSDDGGEEKEAAGCHSSPGVSPAAGGILEGVMEPSSMSKAVGMVNFSSPCAKGLGHPKGH